MENYVEVKNLNAFSDTNKKLIDNISFEVKDGEVFGILGESGAGKSLLIGILTGRYHNFTGSANVAERYHLVPQDPVSGLHPRHSVKEILTEPLKINNLLHEKEERIEKAIRDTHLSLDLLSRYPHELSGGQRQRVCIARVLVFQPKIVFLDEPTSALDAYIRRQILELLQEIKETHSLTYFFVAHSLTSMEFLATRIAIMQQGNILEIVTKEELKQSKVEHPYSKKLISAYRKLMR